jgi:hypothetical protein
MGHRFEFTCGLGLCACSLGQLAIPGGRGRRWERGRARRSPMMTRPTPSPAGSDHIGYEHGSDECGFDHHAKTVGDLWQAACRR